MNYQYYKFIEINKQLLILTASKMNLTGIHILNSISEKGNQYRMK